MSAPGRDTYRRRWEEIYGWRQRGLTLAEMREEAARRGWSCSRERLRQIIAKMVQRERRLGE
jgi:hypothetical protein